VTTFGWDASHYDEPPAVRDGIDFYTHKVTEGDHFYEDAEYTAAMTAGRALGYQVMGSYHVQHGGRSVTSQADWWFSRVNTLTAWWRTFGCWTWQCDAEKFDYMTAPTIAEINALGDAICTRAGCPASAFVAYAPTWVYGSALTGLRYRVWASSYGTNPAGAYRTIYPGDTSSRWLAPVDPIILQYGSRATIAGQTTCDANAYRGTLAQLKLALGGTVVANDELYGYTLVRLLPETPDLIDAASGRKIRFINELAAALARLEGKLDAVLGTLATLGVLGPEQLAQVSAAAKQGAQEGSKQALKAATVTATIHTPG
jgi:hypothetical protein